MNNTIIDYAAEQYKKWGIDIYEVLEQLEQIKISINCWQGDDISGFEVNKNALSGGIQATGDYLGAARNGEELRSDLSFALQMIPGKHKVNLHAIYAETDGAVVGRNELKPEHFDKWISWAKQEGVGLDFNPTFFSHPLSSDGFTLAHANKEIREFWIQHGIASRKIAAYIGKELQQVCVNNFWVPDGYKDTPADRLSPRIRLRESLDTIFAEQLDKELTLDTVESKLFGIGAESYTVGSHDFYLQYAAKNDVTLLMDAGHYHPTEVVSDKISALLAFEDKVALHVSRPVRWDSDHVVALDDELFEIAKEIIRNDATEKVVIGLDFFDASINRVAAWTIGTRNMIKSLLYGLLLPHDLLKEYEENGDYTKRFAMLEEFKTYPYGIVWDYYCAQMQVPVGEQWLKEVQTYEQEILVGRV